MLLTTGLLLVFAAPLLRSNSTEMATLSRPMSPSAVLRAPEENQVHAALIQVVTTQKSITDRYVRNPPSVIELIEKTSDDSPIARFLEKRGPGIHHIAYAVDDLDSALAALKSAGVRLIDETPRQGAFGKRIAFIHPRATGGLLIELCDDGAPEKG